MTTKSAITWKRIGTLALSLTLAWGLGPVYAQFGVSAAAASSTCGSGDHGLSVTLKKGSGVEDQHLQFTDIDFLNNTTGRAAGEGFLIGTSNAGCTWQSIYTGQWQFMQIDFPNNVNGFALAHMMNSAKTYLIRTTDGGSHWNRLDTPGMQFKRIDYKNKNEGYGYTYNGAYRTQDGGLSWIKSIPPKIRDRWLSLQINKAMLYKLYRAQDISCSEQKMGGRTGQPLSKSLRLHGMGQIYMQTGSRYGLSCRVMQACLNNHIPYMQAGMKAEAGGRFLLSRQQAEALHRVAAISVKERARQTQGAILGTCR
ncbi:hypothetical protein [Paenibacillus illinoisensis]|uniref:hypothetical protein n=1 Tax=Paenibacillus illinoisensis TaxID=59845 RepID=UPI003018872A